MSNFQFPMQKGSEFDIPGLHAPATVRFLGIDPESPHGKQVMQHYEGAIRQFQALNAQNYALSGAPQMQKRVVVNPELTLTYNNQWGKELITALVTPVMPQVVQEEEPQEPSELRHDLEDIIYDGCIAICNINAARDDVFEVYLNNQYIGTADFSSEGQQLAYAWYFYQGAPEFAKRLDNLKIDPPVNPAGVFAYPFYLQPDHAADTVEDFIQVVPGDDNCIVNYTGGNTLEMRNIATNNNANYGVVWAGFFSQNPGHRSKVRKGPRLQSSDGSPSVTTNPEPVYFDDQYSGVDGESFTFSFALGTPPA